MSFTISNFEISYTNARVKDKGTLVCTPSHVSVFLTSASGGSSMTVFLDAHTMSLRVFKDFDGLQSSIVKVPTLDSQREYTNTIVRELKRLVNEFLDADKVLNVDQDTRDRVVEALCTAPLFGL